MSEEVAFLKAIAENPDDRTARLVFADWLQERDDPRAAWVRDDDLWEWMKPDAKDPCEAIVQAAKRNDRKARDLLPKLGGHAIPAIFAAYKGAGHGQAFTLGGMIDEIGPAAEVVLPAVLRAADDPNPVIRSAAIRCLSHLVATNARARERVFAALKHTSKDVWYDAAWALDEVGPAGAPAVPDLIRLLRNKDGVWPAARALKSIGPPAAEAAIPELMRLFTSGRDNVEHWFEVRYALAALGAAAVGPLLAAAPGSTGEAFADLVDTLTDIGPAAVPGLQKGAKHKNATTRQAVKEALARLAPEPGVGLLRDPDPAVVGRALDHLASNLNEAGPAVPALAEIVADPKRPDGFRECAARVLGRIGRAAEPSVPALVAAFPAANSALADQLADALDALGRVATTTLLWLAGPHPNRRAAQIAASRIRRGLYGGGRPVVSRQELYTIGARLRKPAGVLEAVTAALTAEPAAAVAALKAALAHENEEVRLVAVVGLWHLGSADAAAAVFPALKDASVYVRAQAAQVLGYIGAGLPGVEAALKAARTEYGIVREGADEALKRLAPTDS